MTRIHVIALLLLLCLMAFEGGCTPAPACQNDQGCAAPRICSEGACQCPSGQTDCSGTCLNLTNDPANCGGCGDLCKAGFICASSVCTCKPGQAACGGSCIDTNSDTANCGGCNQRCNDKETCVKGVCEKPKLNCENPALPVDCGTGCVDTLRNSQFCGDCKNTCANGNQCRNGTCECPLGAALCDGACVPLKSNAAHCGACGNACPTGQRCAGGKCVTECPSAAPQTCGNTCVNLTSDQFHCGTCDNACQPGESCASSKCVCPTSQTMCDSPDGASKRCTDTNADWNHCGACKSPCKGSQLCEQGKCVDACATPNAVNCFGACVNTKENAAHCGGCGKQCEANQTCKDGQCTCATGQTLCKVSESASKDRCVDLSSNGHHCGSCENRCKAGLFCIAGKCQEFKTSCDAQLTPCDGNCVDTQVDPKHCGRCGYLCPSGETCEAGKCSEKLTCQAGTSLCGKVCCSDTLKCCNDQCINPDTPELCNGKDDNCNGKIDDNVIGDGESCIVENQKGPCRDGKRTCENGMFVCKQTYQTKAEDCTNSVDDDCDGIPDGPPCKCTDGNTKPCFSGAATNRGVGECKDGVQTCKGGEWSSCVGEVLPSAELCDGKDNNCNNQIDEGNPESGGACKTTDKGACEAGTQQCKGGKLVCEAVLQPSPETCNNIDDDCDGQIDEDLTQSCYNGPPATKGVGTCKDGTQTCAAGQWGTCIGEIKPAPKEACDGLDDDCDGQIDNGCNCKDGDTQACGSAVGECKKGTQTCVNGSFGTCVGEVAPAAELCDGKDNNCDGKIDEAFANKGQPCNVGVGDCKKSGTFICDTSQATTICDATPGSPGTETCNNTDDDCDGQIDESLSQPCYTGPVGTDGKGLCHKGTQTCSAGKWGTCNGEVVPVTEICDGKDNDCDGQVDEDAGCTCTEGTTQPCGSNAGECTVGTQTCTGGVFGTCSGQAPAPELCDGKDNDCNGSIDETFTDKGQACTVGTGACARTGTLICKADGSGTECDKTPGAPKTETCNNIDDNCNGQVDEGNPGGGGECYTDNGWVCQKGRYLCTNGALVCHNPSTLYCSKAADCSLCPSSFRRCGGLSGTCGGL